MPKEELFAVLDFFENSRLKRKQSVNCSTFVPIGSAEEKEKTPERERPKMMIKQGDQIQNLPDTRRSLTLDVQKYQAMLDNSEMDQSQKAELIETLWMFVISFMDLGYEIKTGETCGKQDPVLDLNERDGSPMLSCKQSRKSVRAIFTEKAAKQEAS